MNVLLAAFELSPYVETTPAAQAILSLAKALRLLGEDVTICVPRSPHYEAAGLLVARQLSPLLLSDGTQATLYDVQLPSGVMLSLIDVNGLELDPNQPPDSQPALVGGFALAVAALVQRRAATDSPFDVVHAHDAAAGLSLLQVVDALSKSSPVPGRVLTIHDATRAGDFPAEAQSRLRIPKERCGQQDFGAGDALCLLKGLVPEADAIITPSDSYGRQIKAPEKFGALSRAFQTVQLHGIPEGVDYAIYNPATDSSLVSRYDAPNPVNKGRNKVQVLGEMELEYEFTRPVVFCENVPGGDSSLETLLGALPALIRNDITLIVSGPKDLREANRGLVETFPQQVKWLDAVSPSDRRRILAASDFYLSLNRRDPSGQRLLQASRYGAIPVSYLTDAVLDIVVDADAELRTGTGIVFESMTQRALVSALARAISAYRSEGFLKLLSRVMRQDLGWDRAARRHTQLYRGAASANVVAE